MDRTIHDVALRAGVSIATVSRVLNNTCPVREDKRRRVLQAVYELDYKPNPAARSLLKQKTGGIGIIIPHIWGEYFSEFIVGIDRVVQAEGCHLLIAMSHRREEGFSKALESMDRRVDGLLVMATGMTVDAILPLLPPGLPVVFVNTPGRTEVCDTFSFDNYDGVFQIANHLLQLGHRRIAFVKGPPGAYDAEQRLQGYRGALDAAGVSQPDAHEVDGDFFLEAGYASADAILALESRPTAVICANDYSAIGVLRAFRDAGIRVPEDLSVVGFDGIPSSRYTTPSLATVQVPIQDIGHAAALRLVEHLNDPGAWHPEQVVLPTQLLLRHSIAPCQSSV